MLTNIIPDNARKVVYAVYAVIGFVTGQIGVGYIIAAATPPLWYLVGAAVVGNLGVAIGATAASNITPSQPVVAVSPVIVPSVTANANGTVTSVAASGQTTTV